MGSRYELRELSGLYIMPARHYEAEEEARKAYEKAKAKSRRPWELPYLLTLIDNETGEIMAEHAEEVKK